MKVQMDEVRLAEEPRIETSKRWREMREERVHLKPP